MWRRKKKSSKNCASHCDVPTSSFSAPSSSAGAKKVRHKSLSEIMISTSVFRPSLRILRLLLLFNSSQLSRSRLHHLRRWGSCHCFCFFRRDQHCVRRCLRKGRTAYPLASAAAASENVFGKMKQNLLPFRRAEWCSTPREWTIYHVKMDIELPGALNADNNRITGVVGLDRGRWGKLAF